MKKGKLYFVLVPVFILLMAIVIRLFNIKLINTSNVPADKNPLLVSNPYNQITHYPIEYDNNKIITPVLPYSDFFSLFIKLPLGHLKATGKNVNVAIVGTSDKSEFVYYTARDSKVYYFDELSVPALLRSNIKIVAVPDLRIYEQAKLTDFIVKCLDNNISVIIEGDQASTDDEIKYVNALESKGAITVGQVSSQGTTYKFTDYGTEAFNLRIKEISINVFLCSAMDGDYNYKHALYGVTGSLAMLLETQKLNPADIKKYLIDNSRNVWQASSVDGTEQYYNAVKVDKITSQYIPNKNSNIFFYKQLDLEKLMQIKLKNSWNSNIYNLQKAWQLSQGNADVAIIDQGFSPDAPYIKQNVVETKCFGTQTMPYFFHGTSMAHALLLVAPQAKLHLLAAVSFSSDKSYETKDIINALDYCIEKRIPIVSMSWGSYFNEDEKFISKIREARDAGITVVWFHYPTEESGIIRPSFVYYGKNQIGAFDRFLEDDMFYPQDIQAGLSFTSPQVAGLAALIKAKKPSLSPAQIENLLLTNSTIIDTRNGNVYIPDMYKILTNLD